MKKCSLVLFKLFLTLVAPLPLFSKAETIELLTQPSQTTSCSKPRGGLLIPLYSYPQTTDGECTAEFWVKVGIFAARVNTIAVVNPYNGPSATLATIGDYNICIDFLRDAGVEVMGYVGTKEGYPYIYSYRDIQHVKDDIDLWANNPYTTIDGIFFDEVTTRWPNAVFDSIETASSFYPNIVDYVLDSKMYNRVVLNPGNFYHEDITEKYHGDDRVITIVYETSQDKFQPEDTTGHTCADLLWCKPTTGCTPPEPLFSQGIWCRMVRYYDGIEPMKELMDDGVILPEQTAVLIHGALDDEYLTREAVNLARANNVGWFWITTDTLPSPFDEPPTENVMNALVDAVINTSSETIVPCFSETETSELSTAYNMTTPCFEPKGGLLIPLYSYPQTTDGECTAEFWVVIGASASLVNTIAVVNPYNGPGATLAVMSDYNICIDFLRDAGVEVVGYVGTKEGYPYIYAYRDIQLVKDDIDLWASNSYTTIDGIFIDEVTDRWPDARFDSAQTASSFYPNIVDYVLDSKMYNRAVLNPGNLYHEEVTEKYHGDDRVITIMYESYQHIFQPEDTTNGTCADLSWCRPETECTPPEPLFSQGIWCRQVRKFDGIESLKKLMDDGVILPEQTAVLIHGALDDEYLTTEAVNLVREEHAAWLWITSDAMPNPWDEPPTENIMNALVNAFISSSDGTMCYNAQG